MEVNGYLGHLLFPTLVLTNYREIRYKQGAPLHLFRTFGNGCGTIPAPSLTAMI